MAITNKDLYEELTKLRREYAEDDKVIEAKIQVLEDKIDKTYVRLTEYEPVRKIDYGLVGAVLLAVISAVLTIVIRETR